MGIAQMLKPRHKVTDDTIYYDGNKLTKLFGMLGLIPGAAIGYGVGSIQDDKKGYKNRILNTIIGGSLGATAGVVPGYMLDTMINRLKAPVVVKQETDKELDMDIKKQAAFELGAMIKQA